MAREKEGEWGPVRRFGHGTHGESETMETAKETADGGLHVSDLTIPNLHGGKDQGAGGVGFEDAFMAVEVPPWREQLTVRGLVVSAVLGAVFCVITHKLNLTVGIIPSLNISAGLLGFFFIKMWTTISTKLGFFTKPFTRQENTVIQTCVVSCYGLAFSGTTSWPSRS